MSTEPRYLLDELETADMLEVDDQHAWQFTLNDALLDRADAAAVASEPFASDEIVVQIESVDGRERRQWSFSYNSVMEAVYCEDEQYWTVGSAPQSRLRCLGAVSASADDE
ncbi:DUF5629 family protein [Stutzerimonas stutzeri]|uniref:DUF5629 domain-containing protein n=1 Tax=Stutzerimonas stutzeri TaxID=316 RepID=A0A172WUG6_STUST|nr:DUF5629 family protein [Stutzerimonas stutzeri]ANF27093.1 hypothetical protein PS273GM_19110 [Stutzerimonas stutzeri]